MTATDHRQAARETTARIDKDYKAELRETAFNLWLSCATQPEIAEAIGYSEAVISEFVNSLQIFTNATGGVYEESAEKEPIVLDGIMREFEDEKEEDSNSLGTYQLDKRFLLKANHLDEHFTPPLSALVSIVFFRYS
jgi:hypothetical protein